MKADGSTKATLSRCPGPATLRGFALGTLTDDGIDTVGAHLADCQVCQTQLVSFEPSSDSFVEYLRDYDESLCREWGYQELCRRLAEYTQTPDGQTQPAALDAPATPESRLVLATPAQLGNYELIEKLGQGAMGTVFRAWHTKLKRTVALKLLSPKGLDDPYVVQRFAREMEALGKLDDHPHVVRARDAGESEGHHYLVMDYVDGIDLGLLLLRAGPLGVADACEAARQAALGLAHAHRHGLVHRDVKPSNLMLTRAGTVQVLDLGLASFRGDGAADDAVVGTADYMAPEQWVDGAQLGVGVDAYGLGCTLYKLLVGHAPFAKSAISPRAKRRAHQKSRPPAVSQARPDVPPELDDLVGRMLAKRPSRRLAKASDIAAALVPFAKDADLDALANRVLGENDDTKPGHPDRTLAQRVFGPLTMAQSTRRRWLGGTLGVAALATAGLWGAKHFFWRVPYEVLLAAEPAYLRWDYDRAVDGLESHSTAGVLYRMVDRPQASFALSTETRRLDRDVEAGLFFGYVETSGAGFASRQFEVVVLRDADQTGSIMVSRRRYTIYINGLRKAWVPEEIASVSLASRTADHLNRLRLVVQDGQLIQVTLDGQEVKDLVGPELDSPVLPSGTAPCGVFSTEGTSFFARTRMES